MTDPAALTREALSRSDVLWVRAGGRDRLTWFAAPAGKDGPLPRDAVVLVSGGGEPDLGDLAGEVEIVLRSKGDGRRLLVVPARAETVGADDERWAPVAALAQAERLNARAGTVERWRDEATLWLLTPEGGTWAPVEHPGRH